MQDGDTFVRSNKIEDALDKVGALDNDDSDGEAKGGRKHNMVHIQFQ